MGQVALGLRSLAFRAAIFVAMASLLAWVLGGTLFPSPQRVNLPTWEFNGEKWHWRVTGSSTEAAPASWTLLQEVRRAELEPRFGIPGVWRHVHGPRMIGDEMLIGVGAEPDEKESDRALRWWLVRVKAAPESGFESLPFPNEPTLILALDGSLIPSP